MTSNIIVYQLLLSVTIQVQNNKRSVFFHRKYYLKKENYSFGRFWFT